MLCHACGGAIADTATVCSHCGASQRSGTRYSTSGAVAPQEYTRVDSPYGIQYRFVQEDSLPHLGTATDTSSPETPAKEYAGESWGLSELTGE